MASDYPVYHREGGLLGGHDSADEPAAQGPAAGDAKAAEEATLAPVEETVVAPTDDIAPFGRVMEVSGGTCTLVVDKKAHAEAAELGGGNGQIGAFVKFDMGGSWVYAIIRLIRAVMRDNRPRADDSLAVELDFIAEGWPDANTGIVARVARGVSHFPIPGQTCWTTTDHDVEAIFSPEGKAHIPIGTIYPSHVVTANLLTDGLLSKHFAILGSTGSGKSCTVALIIHEIVKALPSGHVLILDPHNEYKDAFSEEGLHFDTENLSLPYWLMNFEEHIQVFIGQRTAEKEVDVDILKRVLVQARRKGPHARNKERLTVDSPVPYRIADLARLIEDEMGKLEKPETLLPFLRLKNKIEELKNDSRYGFMFSGLLLSDNLRETVSRLLRMPAQGRPVSTLDLSGVPADIVDVVVSVLSRIVFDFALWSRREKNPRPILLVCEEAHRYVPAEANDRYGAARKSLERIAKEGRKYGVSMGLVTQRPSDLSETVLAQCGTILSMRMNNEKDRRFVENAMPEGSQSFLDSIPAMGVRECIVTGDGVSAPVRVRLSDLEERLRPASDDPDFSETWNEDVGDPDYIDKVLNRWRSQNR